MCGALLHVSISANRRSCVGYRTACHTAHITSKYASIFKECVRVCWAEGCALRVTVRLFDILT